jgi:hypothetical protein
VHVQRLVSVDKMATKLEEYATEEQHSVVHFFVGKMTHEKDIHKEYFLFRVGRVCCITWFTTGLKNSVKDVRK